MNKFKRVLALLLAVLTLTSTVLTTLSSCGDKDDPANQNKPPVTPPGGNENDDGGDETTFKYSVTVKTEGGMLMNELPVLVYEFKDGQLGDLAEYGATDSLGKASFDLTGNVENYAVKIDSSLPDGCDAEPYYRLVGSELTITVKTGLVNKDSVAGKTFSVGDYMYDLTITDVYGKRIKISDELAKNKMVVLNFWYVDCSACQLEFPYMQQVYAEDAYSDKVSIIALNPLDEEFSVKLYADQQGFEFNVAKDTNGIASAFGIEAYPTSVVIDRYGMISLIEVGALPSARAFRVMFDHYISDSYTQSIVTNLDSITPVEKPEDYDINMPSSDEINDAFVNKESFGNNNVDFRGEEDDIYSWPFVIDEYKGESCIRPSNQANDKSDLHGSYSILYANITLEKGQAIAFDYFSSCELYNDLLFVMIDKKDIFRISGVSKDDDPWKTCYAYVAEEAGTYELALCFKKDSDIIEGDDTVYLKDLRIVASEDIDSPTYIFRYASTVPDKYGEYTNYVEVFLGADGYYHVGSATGPLLMADLMNKTHFSELNNIYTMSSGMADEDAIVRYCSYASNSQISGITPVTEELRLLLEKVAYEKYSGVYVEGQTWLEICCYYDSYGTDKELEDPIKGLAPFSAYDTILSETGATDFPNSVEYDRVIMPRGLLFKFVPTVTGVYLVSSDSEAEVNGWIFREEDVLTKNEWIVYENTERMNFDTVNVYMMAYLEAGKSYYIDIAFYDVYGVGEIDFRVEYLGQGGVDGVKRFKLASPGYFTYYESETAGVINKIVAGGIDVELGADNIYREKRPGGSILYADFTYGTPIFSDSILTLIEKGGFNFTKNENDEYILSLMNSTGAHRYYLDLYLKALWGDEYEAKYEEYKVDDVLKGKYHGEVVEGSATKSENDELILGYYESIKTDTTYKNNENFVKYLEVFWDTEFFDEYYDLYQVADVLKGIYHGTGDDLTEQAREIAKNVIKVGYNEVLGEDIQEGDERIGCVIVTKEVADLLQIIMDKYTFEGVDNSWTKLCYYHEYFGPDAVITNP